MEKQDIHSKGFLLDYGKIKVGPSVLEDAVLNLDSLTAKQRPYSKAMIQ